jgi:iron complex transport system permease protein
MTVFAVFLSLFIGSVFISPGQLVRLVIAGLSGNEIPSEIPISFGVIFFQLRLPRTVLIALTGAALAGSGSAYQGLFRNPLADPYLIGIASGAGLGAVAAMSVHFPTSLFAAFLVPAAAFLAGLGTVLLVYRLARVGQSVPVTNLLLAGVTVSAFANALTAFLMLRSQTELRRAIVWLLGGSALTGWEPVLGILPYVIIGAALLIYSGYILNVLQFGEDQAVQLGVSVERAKAILLVGASLSTAAAVAFSGIIGFVGLIIPHVIRLVWSSDYRRILPLSFILGAGLLLIADVLARILITPQEVPLGIITALAGAPFFLWVLRRSKNQAFW